ncbi:Kelch repeat-containing protein [Blastococcus goldschmidtiae]|uniref:Kelch motif-containing protein n=1 Tax=Blastococcus goldschmidtiae TaxID=3075546 RepID=A0ABU2K8B3_9ACTN|nr:hypothetical protein [Blastococcus sp. DSM 46792]MDT0276431.1 hypothetical protein [Blastococcus sp. DSM 46792]
MLASALLAATVTGCSTADAEQAPETGAGWRQLPDPPLGPRDDAVLVGLGDRVLVVGGEEFSCPPNADCTAPQEPLFDDGAVYDSATDAWRATAPPPFGLRRGRGVTAALDGTAYLVTTCADGPACEAPPRLLSYRPDDDRWTDHGPVPGPQPLPRRVTTVGGSLLVYSTGDTLVEAADLLFDPETSAWTELPDDPLPMTDDRFMVPVEGHLVLAASPSAVLPPDTGSADPAARSDRTPAARFDLDRGEWAVLPDAPGQGHQLLPTDRGPLLDGHYSGASGWLLDTGTWTWSALPVHDLEYDDINGVLDRDRAVYDIHSLAFTRLLVYDSVTDAYVTFPSPPGREDVYGDSSTALGRDLVVVGGQRSGTAPGDDDPAADAWLWIAPAG